MDSAAPSKRYLKIGEVARIAALNTSVLRFWESEFDMLRPRKSRSGQRLYSEEDLELVLRIKTLLYDDKLTIAGAKVRLSAWGSGREEQVEESASLQDVRRLLEEVIQELVDFRNSL